jgi:hypothetical protein
VVANCALGTAVGIRVGASVGVVVGVYDYISLQITGGPNKCRAGESGFILF